MNKREREKSQIASTGNKKRGMTTDIKEVITENHKFTQKFGKSLN